MSVVAFEALPDHARLWIYGAEREFSSDEETQLAQQLAVFLAQWTAHKRELQTAFAIRHRRFVLVGVDESQMAASGCSIDALVRYLRQLEQAFGLQMVDTHARVFYRDPNSGIRCLERPEFKQLVEAGRVDENTPVFDNTIQTVGALRAGRWEVPMRASWHGEVFLPSSVTG